MERNRRGRPRHPDVLTPAEWRVLDALREGGTNAEIAERLGLSLDTVKYHVSNMLAKLELRDRCALAAWRPEERRGRLGALFTVPAVVWTVARPIAWVGAGTAAVAGVVVGVVAVVALVAVMLVTAGCDTDPPLAVAPPPTQTSTAIPTATPSPTPTGTPSPTPTPIPATPTPTPSLTATPSPTPTATPTPTPVLTILPLPTREELGIREVDITEVLAAEGLTHVRYEAGEEVPWVPGLFLLDVASRTVEGWVESRPDIPDIPTPWGDPDIPVPISPSNRFLDLDGVLYDRQAERAYRVLGALDQWWGYDNGERLLIMAADGTASVLLDADLRPVAQFQLPQGERFTSPTGGYILVRGAGSIGTFHLVNLEDESNPRVHTWDLPWEPVSNRDGERVYRIEVLRDLVAFVGRVGEAGCRVTRYDLHGAMLSDQPIPCGFSRGLPDATSLPRISPDGRLIAAPTAHGLGEFSYGPERVGMVLSIFDAATGAEVVRILGVHPSWMLGEPYSRGNVWLADSSGIIVLTGEGRFVARIVGRWGPAPGWASPDDHSRFFDYGWSASVVTVGRQGAERVAIPLGSAAPTVFDADPFFRHNVTAGWGAQSEALRVWTSYDYGSHYDEYYGKPPLDPIIELPPLDQSLLVEVAVDTCLNVREEASLDTPVVACLPHGAIAETDDFYVDWMHIRTEDSVEGWAHADYLRWHSDGVRLEE